MNQSLRPSSAKIKPNLRSYSAFSLPFKSLLATGLLLGVILGSLVLSGRGGFLSPPQGDDLTDAQIQERVAAFNALGVMTLGVVSDKDMPQAIESMLLPPAAKEALAANLKEPSLDPSSAPEPAKEAAPDKRRVRLAWISLWDTDVEDGDIVRIDSQGYSRTVILKKQPITFAVPVPANGTINVTGVSDGDGGGITVGLASGVSKAVFPIMSAGQVLGLKVKID